jgi:Cu/Ag efflux protein CusF
MKKITLPLFGLALITSVVSTPAAYANSQSSRSEKATVSRSENRMKAEVVSTDAQAKTITLKTDSGEKTMKVEGRAVRNLKKLKAGEEVWVTSRDYSSGSAVVSLTPAKMHNASGSGTHHHHRASAKS